MSFLDKLINGLTVYFIELFNPEIASYYQYVLGMFKIYSIPQQSIKNIYLFL